MAIIGQPSFIFGLSGRVIKVALPCGQNQKTEYNGTLEHGTKYFGIQIFTIIPIKVAGVIGSPGKLRKLTEI